MDILTRVLNKVAGTIVDGVPTLTATVAANRLAGTSGLSLVGALNRLVGTSGRDLAYVVNQLGGSSGLDVNGAALYYESLPSRLLPTATFWVDAVDSGGSQRPVNLGSGGSTLNPQLGSATSGLIIDPTAGYVYLPGTASNHLSVPDAAALDITGDIDIRVKLAADDWTPAANMVLLAKFATGQISYEFTLTTGGNLSFIHSTDGSTQISRQSTTSLGLTDGSVKWVRVTLDVNNGASGHDVAFYTSDDGSTWTQLGTTVTNSGTTSIFSGTATLGVGARGGGAIPSAGKFYRAQVLNGIGGTTVLDIDCSSAFVDRSQFVASTGQIVTINDTSRDSNDPVWLGHTGTNYVYLPGVSGNSMQVPDSAALDITGDIDLRVHVAADDWTPSANGGLLGKWDGGTTSYLMWLNTSGQPVFYWTDSAGTTTAEAATASVPFADGSAGWVRATFDVDNGSGQRVLQFFTSTDGSTWTQLGSTITRTGTTDIRSGTAAFKVGEVSSTRLAGKFYRAQVYSGIGGTLVCDVDTSVITSGSATSFTEKSSNAATVTINRGTSGRKSVAVTRTVWLLGTDDYLQVADNALLDFNATDSFTQMVAYRAFATSGGERLLRKGNSATGPRWGVGLEAAVMTSQFNDGTNNGISGSVSYTIGQDQVFFGVIDRVAQTNTGFVGFTSGTAGNTSAVGSLEGSTAFRIGAGADNAGYAHAEVMAAAIFRRVLTRAEIAAIAAYYRDRYL